MQIIIFFDAHAKKMDDDRGYPYDLGNLHFPGRSWPSIAGMPRPVCLGEFKVHHSQLGPRRAHLL